MDTQSLCKLCQKLSENPKTLICFHTFCQSCLELYCRIKGFHQVISCSFCQKKTEIPAGGIAELPCNPFVTEYLEEKAREAAALKLSNCQGCNNSEAVKVCKNCNNKMMCEACLNQHDEITKPDKHEVSELLITGDTDTDEVPPCEFCESASSKFCKECNFYICGKCLMFHGKFPNNKTHILSDIKASNDPVICGMCSVKPSTMQCKECPQNMCETCTGFHAKFPGAASHHVEKIQKKAFEFSKQIYCKDHPKKSMKAYCERCKILVCDNCTSTNHMGHSTIIEDSSGNQNIKVPTSHSEKDESKEGCDRPTNQSQVLEQTQESHVSSEVSQAPVMNQPPSEGAQVVQNQQSSINTTTEKEIYLKDFDKYSITRSSLGRSANLGQLYNMRTDEFLNKSVFAEIPASKSISEEDCIKKLIKFDSQSPQECLAALELSSEEKLNVLVGISKPEGHAAFLQNINSCSMGGTSGVVFRIKTKEEKLQRYQENIISQDTLDGIISRDISATHFVAGIKWGATAVLIAENSNANVSKKPTEISEISASSALTDAIQKDVRNPRQVSSILKNCKVNLFTDRLPKAYETANTDEEKIEHFQTLEKVVNSTKESKGWPVKYLLLPIRLLNDKAHEKINDVSSCEERVSDETCEMVVVDHEKMNAACREFEKLFNDVKEHEICIKPEVVNKIVQFRENVVLAKENLIQKLVATLSRFDNCDDAKIESIITESRNGPASASKIKKLYGDVLPDVVKKIAIKKELDKYGVIYVGKGDRICEVRATRNIKTYYALFFNPEQKDCDSCVRYFIEIAKSLSTSDKDSEEVKFIAVDLQTTQGSTQEEGVPNGNCICVYADGAYQQSIVSQDIERQKKQNWAHSDSISKLDTKPMDRIIVEMPCPCSINQRERKPMRWLCRGCGTNIQSDADKKMFFCDCGWAETHSYTFFCGSDIHGNNPIPYQQSELDNQLKSLKAVRNINILILGATGVGKSTWINGIVNYITYETLKQATNAEELITLVPSSFSMTDSSMKLKWIKVGSKHGTQENEVESTKGESATQGPMTYCFQYEDVNVRLIDTPGIGDVRGIEQDKTNFDLIMRHLRNFESLQGICILLKPNDARLNVIFRFCISELLAHLHRDAAKNIVFCFTNARSTFYLPGDTLPPLQAMLQKYESEQGVVINTTPETVYCMDNEPFRFLCAMKARSFSTDEVENYTKSWEKSRKETMRLFDYIKGLKSHSMADTLSLNDARETILALMQPMAEISKTINTNIKVMEERKKEISLIDVNDTNLKEKLYLEKIEIVTIELELPTTVCTAAKCTGTARIGNTNTTQVIYKKQCHKGCYLKGVVPDTYPNPELQKCASLRQTGNCIICGCKWDVHIHVMYYFEQRVVQEVDEKVQQMINEGANNKDVLKTAVGQAEDLMKKLNDDRVRLMEISAKFGSFLKTNAIVPYNDAFDEYILFRIREEKDRVASGGSDANLVSLENLQAMYKEQVKVLKSAMSEKDSTLTPKDINKLRDELYQMRNGETMKAIANIIANSKIKASQAKQVNHSPTHHRHGGHRGWMSGLSGLARPLNFFRGKDSAKESQV